MNKKIILILLILSLFSGCAKVVSTLPTNVSKVLTFTINFQAAPNLLAGQTEIIVALRAAGSPQSPVEAFPTQNFTLHNPQDIDDSNTLFYVEEIVDDYFNKVFNM